MSNCDYGLRSKVLKSEIYKAFLDARKQDYKQFKYNGVVGTEFFNMMKDNLLNDCLNNDLTSEEQDNARECYLFFLESVKIRESSRKQVQRLKQRITTLLNSGACVFLTLTFKTIEEGENEQKKRKLKVVRFLKENTKGYVANIDFGKQNEREHYHAVALIGEDLIDSKKWKEGSLDIKRVNKGRGCSALAKYVSKLTNHAIKETTKRQAIIYSR